MARRRGHGEGSIIKRGETYSAVLTVGTGEDGRRIRKWQSGFATKRDATTALAELRSRVDRGEYVAPSRDTVEAFLLDWLGTVRRTLKATTWSAYDGEIRRHVIPRIGQIPLAKLTGSDLDRMYEDLLTNGRLDGHGGLSPKSVRGIATTLGSALTYAERTRLIARSPRRDSTPPRPPRSNRAAELAWGRDELLTFLTSWEGTPLYTFYRLAATTGMRRGELLGLRWSDIGLESGKVSMVRSVVIAGKRTVTQAPKSGRGRSIQLDAASVEVLRRHREANAANARRIGYNLPDAVFVHGDGRPFTPNYVSERLKVRRRQLGLPDGFRLHDARHLSATLAMRAGTPLKVVSERLGHASIVVTADIYSHVSPDMQSEAAEKLAAMID